MAIYQHRRFSDEEWEIHCPCGFQCTHQGRVRVWIRDREDSPTGLYTEIGEEVSHFRGTLPPGNPSSRRQGLAIDFLGECGHEFTVYISQHKGDTFVSFSEPRDAPSNPE